MLHRALVGIRQQITLVLCRVYKHGFTTASEPLARACGPVPQLAQWALTLAVGVGNWRPVRVPHG